MQSGILIYANQTSPPSFYLFTIAFTSCPELLCCSIGHIYMIAECQNAPICGDSS